MRPPTRRSDRLHAWITLTFAALVVAQCRPAATRQDPLAAEIARWSAFAERDTSSDEMWLEVKGASVPALTGAQDALERGCRFLALNRLSNAQMNLAAFEYLKARPQREEDSDSAFAAEWTRMRSVLGKDLGPLTPDALAGVRPAAVRALGEAALPQVGIYYEASLDYGRSTMPKYGLFYVGSALAQRDFAAFCRTLREPVAGRAPPLRSLVPELDALEGELLAAYRPPLSIDRHPAFILASSLQKEARALDHAGLRYGALLRYLQAAQRLVPLRTLPGAAAPDSALLASQLDAFAERLGKGDVDHTIGRMFVESARADLDGPAPDTSDATAAAIVGDVLPRYFAALGPAPAQAARAAPLVTVTLVRWPFT